LTTATDALRAAIADMALARSEDSPATVHSMSAQIQKNTRLLYDIWTHAESDDGCHAWMKGFSAAGRALDRAQEPWAVSPKARFWDRIRM